MRDSEEAIMRRGKNGTEEEKRLRMKKNIEGMRQTDNTEKKR